MASLEGPAEPSTFILQPTSSQHSAAGESIDVQCDATSSDSFGHAKGTGRSGDIATSSKGGTTLSHPTLARQRRVQRVPP